jgi:hypothetical protein
MQNVKSPVLKKDNVMLIRYRIYNETVNHKGTNTSHENQLHWSERGRNYIERTPETERK